MKLTTVLLLRFAVAELMVAPFAFSKPHDTPVLLELFTSEGCSSCPPADALLATIDRQQSTAGVQAIVLSEHVDYWNHIGWSDPFSSGLFSNRQTAYASRFGLDGVYTPELVVDGSTEFVGSDAAKARSAIEHAGHGEKLAVQLSLDTRADAGWRASVQVDPSPALARPADVYLAIAQAEATSDVRGGENGGRRLHHVAVVKTLKLLGRTKPGATFRADLPVSLSLVAGHAGAAEGMRVVAFVQEHGQGRVLGAAEATTPFPL